MKIDIIGWFEKAYLRLPRLGPDLRDYLVRIFPYLSLVFGLLITLASVLELLGTPFISLFSSKSSGLPVIQMLLLTNVLGVFQGILMIFASGPLKAKKERGWRLLFWSQILWLVASALSFSSSVVLSLIVFYPIMQAKSEYK